MEDNRPNQDLTNQDIEFIKEKVKERPLNRRKLFKKTLLTASMAAIFGLIACVTFLVLEPVFSNLLYPEEEPQQVELKEENELSGECVLGNATQLQQVLLNISINAIHAIGAAGGKLTIRGSVVPRSELAALFPEEKISEEWSSYVCLSVTDTGCGMDKETMQHIFEPFFTTHRQAGRAAGLGLSVATGLAHGRGGQITAANRPEGGALFRLLLPLPVSESRSEGNE